MILRSRILKCLCQQRFLKYQTIRVEHLKCFQRFITPCAKFYSQEPSTVEVKIKAEKNVEPVNKFVNRTHTCGELTINNVDENVQLCGWLEFQRMGKFLVLRDCYGSTQCIVNEKRHDLTEKIQNLSYETVLSVTGTVISRPKEMCNPKMSTGDIEVLIDSLDIFNLAPPKLPFSIRNFNKAKEQLQMQYRYLALRFPNLQRNLRIRSWVTMKMREYLINQCGFVDVVTPTLFRKTPGGAKEFVVPTRHLGKFYSLVQSPQQFKQLLMVGGIDRYFQIAQCYRDEGSRSDRQPEFTQLDIEMSFVDQEGVMKMIEQLIVNSWPEIFGLLQIPFCRLTYEEAMEIYGTESPDLRIPGRIHNISAPIEDAYKNIDKSFEFYATVFPERQKFLTKSVKEKLDNVSKQFFQNAKSILLKISTSSLEELKNLFSESTRKSIVDKLNLKKDDVLLLTYGPKSDARQLLGRLRVEFTNILESKGEIIRSPGYMFLWIVDFPLFAINSGTNALETAHHPFTQPHPKDIQHLITDPLKVRGLQYDLVLNGSEIGGGSIRIHQKELQEQIMKMLNIDLSQMNYFLNALGSGAPPHGGIALGLDRYISMICDTSSIRDVIAFPKTMQGCDLMADAPALISEEDKKLYHIQTLNDNVNKSE